MSNIHILHTYIQTCKKVKFLVLVLQDKEDNNRHNNHINAQYTFTPEEIKYDNKHYKYLKYTAYKKVSGLTRISSGLFSHIKLFGNWQDSKYQEDKHKMRNYNEVVEKQQQKFNKNSNLNGETLPINTECM